MDDDRKHSKNVNERFEFDPQLENTFTDNNNSVWHEFDDESGKWVEIQDMNKTFEP